MHRLDTDHFLPSVFFVWVLIHQRVIKHAVSNAEVRPSRPALKATGRSLTSARQALASPRDHGGGARRWVIGHSVVQQLVVVVHDVGTVHMVGLALGPVRGFGTESFGVYTGFIPLR